MINRSILRAVGLSSVVLLGTLPTEQAWGFTNKTSKTGRTSPSLGAARSLSLEPFVSARARASQARRCGAVATVDGKESLVAADVTNQGRAPDRYVSVVLRKRNVLTAGCVGACALHGQLHARLAKTEESGVGFDKGEDLFYARHTGRSFGHA